MAQMCPLVPHNPVKAEVLEGRSDFVAYTCLRCGRFALPDPSGFLSALSEEQCWKLSACLRERTLHGRQLTAVVAVRPSVLDDKINIVAWEDLLKEFPGQSVPERFERALLNLSKVDVPLGTRMDFTGHGLESVTFAEHRKAASYVLQQLAKDGLIEYEGGAGVILTAMGWNRVAELSLRPEGSNSRQIFVALKQSGDWESLRDSLTAGVEAAGFKARVVTDVQHNEKIDDRIIAEIRRSQCLVADLTGERPNVYYEAGFARALGKHVIFTCKMGTEVHFDIRQYNRIEWETSDQLEKDLEYRIRATIL